VNYSDARYPETEQNSETGKPEIQGDITRRLVRLKNGDHKAMEEIYELVYDHLRMIAASQLSRETVGHTLSRTDLVHESFFKMVGSGTMDLHDRRHFFRIASRAMRQILTDHARKKLADKRGGGEKALSLDEERTSRVNEESENIVQISDALEKLREEDERLAELVELRFFGGLGMEEIGEVMGTSRRTASRDWKKAKAWLYTKLND
jgi:RNA polymerase sigma factor (TIGR02999 family)